MKPCIIYIDNDCVYGEMINISKKDFERIINEVYEQGRQEGIYHPVNYPISYPTNSPTLQPSITWSTSTGTSPNIKLYNTTSTTIQGENI